MEFQWEQPEVSRLLPSHWHRSPTVYIKGYWLCEMFSLDLNCFPDTSNRFAFLVRDPKVDDKLGLFVGVDHTRSGLAKVDEKGSNLYLFIRVGATAELKNRILDVYDRRGTMAK